MSKKQLPESAPTNLLQQIITEDRECLSKMLGGSFQSLEIAYYGISFQSLAQKNKFFSKDNIVSFLISIAILISIWIQHIWLDGDSEKRGPSSEKTEDNCKTDFSEVKLFIKKQ